MKKVKVRKVSLPTKTGGKSAVRTTKSKIKPIKGRVIADPYVMPSTTTRPAAKVVKKTRRRKKPVRKGYVKGR